jgi:hypothetical protein
LGRDVAGSLHRHGGPGDGQRRQCLGEGQHEDPKDEQIRADAAEVRFRWREGTIFSRPMMAATNAIHQTFMTPRASVPPVVAPGE